MVENLNEFSFRLRDILLSLFGLISLSPILLVIILLLFFTQRKVFFRQQRPGKQEKLFLLIKFSTLRDIVPGEDEYSNQQTRLTHVGKYLRKYSLDELPQLINVLKGDMSLIGPRPLLKDYLPLYTSEERRRHNVLPGITGWAQIHGRNQLSFKQKFAYDLWYVSHKSHLLDSKIIWKTLFRIFQTEGVYVDEKTTAEKYNGAN
ncbi:UNVERIFIED_CONTAM: hypothetical protein GTU68_032267 [Idotea baltica]|nr:hypothetical protein [Idotea baltica]